MWLHSDVVCWCQAELESLNSAADSINKLENELQVGAEAWQECC